MSSRRRRAVRDDDDDSSDGARDESSGSESEAEPAVTEDAAPAKDTDAAAPSEQPEKSSSDSRPPLRTRAERGNRRGPRENDRRDTGGKTQKSDVKKGPAFVPRGGQFFLHDNRQDSNSNSKEDAGEMVKKPFVPKESKQETESAWKHDKFEENPDEDTRGPETTGRTSRQNGRRNRRNKSDGAVLHSHDDGARQGPPPQPALASSKQRSDRREKRPTLDGPTGIEAQPQDTKTREKTHLQQRKPDAVSAISTKDSAAVDKSKQQLKASAPEFNPSPGKPRVDSTGAAPIDRTAFLPSHQSYRGSRKEHHYDRGRNHNAASYASVDSTGYGLSAPSQYGIGPDGAVYPNEDYSGSGMYSYAPDMNADGYYPDAYGYPQTSAAYSAGSPGSRGQGGTVWFPTTPSGAVDPVSSAAVYNGTQYFPTSPAPVYYDQQLHSGGSGEVRKGYKGRGYSPRI